MRRPSRLLLATAAALAAGGLGAGRAQACGGSGGYTYAGLAAPSHAFGVGAIVTPLGDFDVLSGHIAGWVGVGGPGLGPNGTDEWIQVGFSGFPGLGGNDLYYEVMRPSGQVTYHQIASGLPAGQPARVAVLEMSGHPNVWRVWLNGTAVSEPIYLPGSHGRWSPIATAESWDGGAGGACNDFVYRFQSVRIARFPGGGWHQLVDGYPITSSTTRVQRSTHHSSFLAAQGARAFRTLASFSSSADASVSAPAPAPAADRPRYAAHPSAALR